MAEWTHIVGEWENVPCHGYEQVKRDILIGLKDTVLTLPSLEGEFTSFPELRRSPIGTIVYHINLSLH